MSPRVWIQQVHPHDFAQNSVQVASVSAHTAVPRVLSPSSQCIQFYTALDYESASSSAVAAMSPIPGMT
jgi:hypothetical protein